jgi:glutamyl-Q tRNA(Asp) synthetase
MIVTRFAPSPTGLLHVGHAFAAMTAANAARGGRFLVRIEDIDAVRARTEFEDAIYEDLAWLGLQWPEPVLRQSQRLGVYNDALTDLKRRGLVYPCFCTRRDIAEEVARSSSAPHGPEGPLYPGTCRRLAGEEREHRIARGDLYALRLDVGQAASRIGELQFVEKGSGPAGEQGSIAVNPHLFGDVVLARKDIPASYHLAVTVDDAFQGVTLVTRGNDLFSATHIQRLLQALLDLPAPHYAHHRLILDEEGRKFSKRDQAVTLRSLRQSGVSAAALGDRLFGR